MAEMWRRRRERALTHSRIGESLIGVWKRWIAGREREIGRWKWRLRLRLRWCWE
ncbi:hypothetical protein SLEP1_g46324 [Rubroshorea leprosula]|uniref:Uncharacterized protein n=1 Tax=Rubroshorea leprosula TaxID=152421 RepID=A0AAV5LLZ9_9ROSI|nr:hypothetical protein SLEP1_g46324 [Rubroshorea leprosula]